MTTCAGRPLRTAEQTRAGLEAELDKVTLADAERRRGGA
jgi:hypothetical protein